MKCQVCGQELCKQNKTGLCRSCGNRDPEHRKKNANGVKLAHLENRIPNFTKEASLKGQETYRQRKKKEFVANPNKKYAADTLRNNLILSGRKVECEECGRSIWNNKPLLLEVHHKDGDRTNNSFENLQFLCPNCHSQTETFRSKNIQKTSKRKKVSDEDLIIALRTSNSIREALISVKLAPKGGNYIRAYKLLDLATVGQKQSQRT